MSPKSPMSTRVFSDLPSGGLFFPSSFFGCSHRGKPKECPPKIEWGGEMASGFVANRSLPRRTMRGVLPGAELRKGTSPPGGGIFCPPPTSRFPNPDPMGGEMVNAAGPIEKTNFGSNFKNCRKLERRGRKELKFNSWNTTQRNPKEAGLIPSARQGVKSGQFGLCLNAKKTDFFRKSAREPLGRQILPPRGGFPTRAPPFCKSNSPPRMGAGSPEYRIEIRGPPKFLFFATQTHVFSPGPCLGVPNSPVFCSVGDF